jgi:membrane fusion protein (multidrug efflux system)
MHTSNSIEVSGSSKRPLRRTRWFWPLALLALATGAASMLLVNRLSMVAVAASVAVIEDAMTMRLSPLEVVTVEARRVEDVVKVTGTIHPAQEANIAAQVGGLAETVTVQRGDTVDQGQLLVEVGTTDLQLQLDQQRSTLTSSEVQLRNAQTTLTRTMTLAERGLAAQNALDAAQAEVDQLTAGLATQQTLVVMAEANLARARVVAPFAGTVAGRSIEPGQIVDPGTTMLSIVDLSRVRVDVLVALRDAARVAVGQTVRLTVQGMPDRALSGTVDRISPVAEAGTRSLTVHLTLDNPEGLLRGGMFVTGDILVADNDNVLAVPSTAIQTRGDTRYVLAIEDGVIAERVIAVGSQWPMNALVEATSGLAAGDTIVAMPLSGLTIGDAVTIEGN